MDNLSVVLSIIFGIVGAIGTYYLISILRDACVIPSILMDPEEENDNEQAVSNVVELIKDAKREIEIFDDGNDFVGSAYNNDALIEAVRDKFDQNPDFKIRVLFNYKSPQLKFIQEFKENTRVEIYVRKDGERPPDRHYKIIDGGIKGNISKHSLEEGEKRTYQNFHCAAKSKIDMSKAGRNVRRKLGQPIKSFERLQSV